MKYTFIKTFFAVTSFSFLNKTHLITPTEPGQESVQFVHFIVPCYPLLKQMFQHFMYAKF